MAYRELRALEHQIIARRRELDRLDGTYKKDNEARFQFDGFEDTKIRMSNFAGIEIEDWPAAIAETAMLLVDHQANQDMADEVGQAMVRLPIDQMNRARIIHGNALRRDWAQILEPTVNTYIVGNPPFIGQKERTTAQKSDLREVWQKEYDGYFDYVTGWYRKAIDYFGQISGHFAFVSTNSVTQGQPVAPLFRAVFNSGWEISFAHRNFAWTTESTDCANVTCVIIGFRRSHGKQGCRLWDYGDGKDGKESLVSSLNEYLLPLPRLLLEKRMQPISNLPLLESGSKAVDWKFYLLDEETAAALFLDPAVARYVRLYLGGEEVINGTKRHTLWFEGANLEELMTIPIVAEKIDAVKKLREASNRPQTRKAGHTPHLFGENRQPRCEYLALPQTFSENRRYLTGARFTSDVIASIKLFTVKDEDGFAFAIASSSMMITWQRAIGGRMRMDLSLSNTVVWNNLPLPPVDGALRQQIIEAGKGVLAARELYPERSLAEHYKPDNMDPALLAAHDALDILVDRAFGAAEPCANNDERLAILFQRYLEMTGE